MRALTILLVIAIIIIPIQGVFGQLQFTEESNSLWAQVYDATIQGDYVYSMMHNGLVVIDASDPKRPKRLAELPMGGMDDPDIWGYSSRHKGIVANGNFLYIVDGSMGTNVVDISDPTNPVIVNRSDQFSGATDVAIAGNHLFVVYLQDFWMVEISDPVHPSIVGQLTLTDRATSIDVAGNMAFIGIGHSGMLAVDISRPELPELISTVETDGWVEDVCIEGDHAYLADSALGLITVDISNPTNPTVIDLYSVQGNAMDLLVRGQRLYVSADNGDLITYQITDASSPIQVHRFVEGWITQWGVDHQQADISIAGDLLLSSGIQGIRIFDLARRDRPVLSSRYFVPRYITDVVVLDEFAYVAGAQGGFGVVDVSNPQNPVVVGSCNLPSAAVRIEVVGKYAYVAGYLGGLNIVKLHNRAKPRLVGRTYGSLPVEDIVVRGDYCYVAQVNNLAIYDVSRPSKPKLVGETGDGVKGWRLSMWKNYIVLVGHKSGMYIIDVSNPANPVQVCRYDSLGQADYVQVVGHYAHVVSSATGKVIILDISNPAEPKQIAQYGLNDHITSVVIKKDRVWISSSWNGVSAYDISKASNPVLLGKYDTPGQAVLMDVVDNYAYIADLFSMPIFRIDDIPTDIATIDNDLLPNGISLGQNYPNPFNPTTVIEYALPEPGQVDISVFNVLGQQVATLHSGFQPAGEHTVVWDAIDFASGVYFYKLSSEGNVVTKKMVLAK